MDQDEALQKLKAHAFKLISIRPRSISEIRTALTGYARKSTRKNKEHASPSFWQASSERVQNLKEDSFRSRTSRDDNQNLSSEYFVEMVIDDLTQRKYLDDAAFVRWWMEQRDHFRPKGKRALLAELSAKGVDRTIIDQAISALSPDRESEYNQALALAQKRYIRLTGDSAEKQKIRLSRYLQSRGFDWQTIHAVIDSVFQKE